MAVPTTQLHFAQMRLPTGMSIAAQSLSAQRARKLCEFAVRQLFQRQRIECGTVVATAGEGHHAHRHADLALSRICMTAVCGARVACPMAACGQVTLSNCGSRLSGMKRVRAA